MWFFDQTARANADAIRAGGFRATVAYGREGVWVYNDDCPPGWEQGARVRLEIDVPDDMVDGEWRVDTDRRKGSDWVLPVEVASRYVDRS
jgi:hypothetical protein